MKYSVLFKVYGRLRNYPMYTVLTLDLDITEDYNIDRATLDMLIRFRDFGYNININVVYDTFVTKLKQIDLSKIKKSATILSYHGEGYNFEVIYRKSRF